MVSDIKKLKILALSHSVANGGAELALKSLIESTSEVYEWSVIYPSKKNKSVLLINGVFNTYYIPMPWWCYEGNDIPSINKKLTLKNIQNIKNISKNYDILLTNTMTIPWLAYASAEIIKPHIWYVHEYGNLDHKLNFILGYDMSLHKIEETSSRIMTISNNLKNHLSKIINSDNISIINQSVDLNTYTKIPVKQYTKQPKLEDITIATIAALRPSKGQHLLINTIYEMQKVGIKTPKVIIRGPDADASYVAHLQNISHKVRGVDVRVGFVEPKEILSNCDVVFVGSDNEALGRGTLEGMSSGRLVLGSNTGATTELLADGRGCLFDLSNEKSLRNGILKLPSMLFERDPVKSRTYVKDNYSVSRQKEDFMNIVKLSMYKKPQYDPNTTKLVAMYREIKLKTTIKNKIRRGVSKVKKFLK
jgi:glycosyltransferase involved in cell wall biosynthesis